MVPRAGAGGAPAVPLRNRMEPDLARFYLGVDGGGTNCRMRLADDALSTLAEAEIEANANLQVENGDSAWRAVAALADEVFAAAGLDAAARADTFACFGMAGGRMKSDCEAFARRDWPFAAVRVFDDIDIARAGALGGEDGAALIVGTGSAGLGIMDGVRHQCGGWGFHVGDTMSGAILGRELVRTSLLAFDGLVQATPLTEKVVETLGGDGDAVMAWSFNLHGEGQPARPGDYGELVPLFFEFFERGDPVARDLMEFQLRAIDQYVEWFRARGAPAVAVVGGLGRRLYPQLVARYGDIIVEPRDEPLAGALILARQLFEDA